ncbi:MAG: hypothetical protein JXR63_10365 [Spirochaetales bacterium]|nr:hypothetical protein [Spirochaetales bacterium]
MEDMKKFIVLTNTESEIGEKLRKLYLDQGYTIIELSNTVAKEQKSNEIIQLEWNQNSPLSAARVIREIMNITGLALEAVIFIHTPDKLNQDFHTLQMTELEGIIDKAIKGTTSLVKEILNKLKTNIVFIFDNEGNEELSAIDTIIYGSKKSIATAITNTYRNTEKPPITIENIHGTSEEFSNYVETKLFSKNTKGKTYTYTKVNKIFSTFNTKKQKRQEIEQ